MSSSDTRCSQKCEYSTVFPICQAYHLHSFSSSFWPVAKFIVSDLGDRVNSGIGLVVPARYIGYIGCTADRGMTTLYAGVNYILQSGTKNLTIWGAGGAQKEERRGVDGGRPGGGGAGKGGTGKGGGGPGGGVCAGIFGG